MVMLHIKLKKNQVYSNMVYAKHPPPPQALGNGSVGQNTTFSEHGHVAYQNKENHECSDMVAIILL